MLFKSIKFSLPLLLVSFVSLSTSCDGIQSFLNSLFGTGAPGTYNVKKEKTNNLVMSFSEEASEDLILDNLPFEKVLKLRESFFDRLKKCLDDKRLEDAFVTSENQARLYQKYENLIKEYIGDKTYALDLAQIKENIDSLKLLLRSDTKIGDATSVLPTEEKPVNDASS